MYCPAGIRIFLWPTLETNEFKIFLCISLSFLGDMDNQVGFDGFQVNLFLVMDGFTRYDFCLQPTHVISFATAIDLFHKWQALLLSFVCMQISLTGLVYE